MDVLDFTFEFHAEIPDLRDELERDLYAEAEERLRALSVGHTDLTGASVALEQPAHGESSYLYQARVVVYGRPEHVSATEKGADLRSTLKSALSAVERQVRERRAKLAEPWKRP